MNSILCYAIELYFHRLPYLLGLWAFIQDMHYCLQAVFFDTKLFFKFFIRDMRPV